MIIFILNNVRVHKKIIIYMISMWQIVFLVFLWNGQEWIIKELMYYKRSRMNDKIWRDFYRLRIRRRRVNDRGGVTQQELRIRRQPTSAK